MRQELQTSAPSPSIFMGHPIIDGWPTDTALGSLILAAEQAYNRACTRT
jgi:hypothetical protein